MYRVISFLLLCVAFFFSIATEAQEKYTISGYVKDISSGEPLIGTTIFNKKTYQGTTSNQYGFYSLTLSSDTVEIVFSYVGYSQESITFLLNENRELSRNLSSSSTLQEIVITGEQEIQERSDMSTIQMDMDIVKSLPVLLGERDLLKTIQLLPGVQSGSEGSSGIYVRGGGPDQNLILLDGVPIYNASHLFGFFSVFNPDALSNVELIKGGFPARYGGRLSSVLDIRMKEGNMNTVHGEGGIGLISSRFTIEGPIKSEKTSFLFSGRRTYIDLLAQPFIRAAEGDGTGGYFFYDANAKFNHIIDDKNRVYLSGYFGNDKAYARYQDKFQASSEKVKARLSWGNAIVSARWNRILSPKLFANTTATFSNYRFVTGIDVEYFENGNKQGNDFFEYRSGIRDLGVKTDLDFLPNPNHFIKMGLAYTHHTFTPGVNQLKDAETDTTFGSPKVYASEFALFAEDDWKVNSRIKVNGGLRLSGFAVDQKFYYGIEPRFSGRYLINDNISAKVSYAHMQQYLHLLTNGSVGLPTDLWVPVTGRVKPQISDQVAAGMASTLKNGYQLSIEGYYKWMNGLLEYKDGASFQGTADDWQNKVEAGLGWSYGAELLLRKRTGKLTGWIGYTLSWSTREFENINFGNKFPYKFDRRHDASLVLNYKFNEFVDAGLVWVYGTGNSISLPNARYEAAQGQPGLPSYFNNHYNSVEHIEERNGYRMAAYHRLDLGVNFRKEMKKGHERIWSFGIYNAYSRQNPFFLYFSRDEFGDRKLYQASLFPFIPSFTYNFKF